MFPHLSIFILPKQNYTAEVNCLVALHELYKYINKYYDQVSTNQSTKTSLLGCMLCFAVV